MTESHGRFSWYELLTTDMEAARTFYADVVGWGTQDASAPGNAYTFFRIGQAPVSGMMNLPEEVGARRVAVLDWVCHRRRRGRHRRACAATRWLGSSSTDRCSRRQPCGCRHRSANDDDRSGQMVDAARGAGLCRGQNGRVGWHELLAVDGGKALPFYSALFGWQNGGAETSAGRDYQFVSVGGQTFGGMFTKPPMVKLPFWLFYFGVGDIDAAAERVRVGGGKILEGPGDTPGGWIARCEDPQGAMLP